jgi:hypothetical protein
MADSDLDADRAAEQHARRIVGRVALQKMSALARSWKEEEEAEKRVSRLVLVGLVFFIILVALATFAFYGQPSVRSLVMSLGFIIILAVGVIIWSHRRQTEQPKQSVKADAQKK